MAVSHQEHAAGCEHRPRSGRGWIFVAFALMAVVLLWEEHRAHILGVIPYLILFSCPLMHLLHRHGQQTRRRWQGGSSCMTRPPMASGRW